MLQLKCTQINSTVNQDGHSMSIVHFELMLNGKSTRQFAKFELQPDYCDIGDLFTLTAEDFDESVKDPQGILDKVWEDR